MLEKVVADTEFVRSMEVKQKGLKVKVKEEFNQSPMTDSSKSYFLSWKHNAQNVKLKYLRIHLHLISVIDWMAIWWLFVSSIEYCL